jgi:hypothetical protein
MVLPIQFPLNVKAPEFLYRISLPLVIYASIVLKLSSLIALPLVSVRIREKAG